jgi:hypothetical protein
VSRQIVYAADFDAMNALLMYLTENCCAGIVSAPICEPAKTGCYAPKDSAA